MLRRRVPLVALILIGSCQGPHPIPGGGRSVSEVYGAGKVRELRVRDQRSPLQARRAIPVLSAPEVFAVYVPTHVDRKRNLMIGEHWVFFKLREAEWFVEKGNIREPAVSGKAADHDWKTLRSVPEEAWKGLLVPHR